MPGCGKEEFVKIAMDEGYNVIRMGDVVREYAGQSNIDKSDESIGKFANTERELHHSGIWAERTLERLSSNKAVIDGVRGEEEIELFKKELGRDMQIIAIHASPQTRYRRLKKRGRDDAPLDKKQFDQRDERELGWGLGKVISKADHMIVNEGSLDDFRRDVRSLLSQY